MSDELTPTPEAQSDLDAMQQALEAAAGGHYAVGDKISGTICEITPDAVYVSLGGKSDAVVEAAELKDENGQLTVNVGDTVELYVVAVAGSQVKLSRALSGFGGMEQLKTAFEGRLPVEGKVAERVKGGYRVDVLHRKAFCPGSLIDCRPGDDPDSHVGQTYSFLIIKLDDKGRNVVLSRRELQDREDKEQAKVFYDNAKPGEVFDGEVVRLAPFGAFVRIAPGVEGMAHISELSWSRVEKPEEAVSLGQNVRAKLLAITQTDKGPRVSVSIKQAAGDPWAGVAQQFKPGDKVQARILRLAPYGAFAELAPGVEGLIHISELSFTKRVHRADEVVNPGQQVEVLIKDVDPAAKRISLSLKAVEGDPWVDATERFKLGGKVEGVLERKNEKFGWFVSLAPGITGLLPRSRIAKSEKAEELEKIKPGDPVTVVVEELDLAGRKLTLNLPGEDKGGADWKAYSGKAPQAVDAKPSLGALGQALQAAMNAKNDK